MEIKIAKSEITTELGHDFGTLKFKVISVGAAFIGVIALVLPTGKKVRETTIQAKTLKEIELDFEAFQRGWEKYFYARVFNVLPKGNNRITYHEARLLGGYSKMQMAEIFGISLDWYTRIEGGTSKSSLKYIHIMNQIDSIDLPGFMTDFLDWSKEQQKSS